MFHLISIALITIILYMTVWYFIALLKHRNDVADIAWGLGFIVVCTILYSTGAATKAFLVIYALTTLWGLRLTMHIHNRNKGKKEDFRYKKWRDDWGKWFYIRTYLQVFLLQGLFMLLISLSAIVTANSSNNDLTVLSYIGILIWLIGFFFESVGDLQLSRFISDSTNKDKIMNKGLWRYTRHPNYFGEVTQWWGIAIIAIVGTYSLIPIISALTITFLILKVSGIPMLEEKYSNNLEFQQYKKITNAFFPWFPKNAN